MWLEHGNGPGTRDQWSSCFCLSGQACWEKFQATKPCCQDPGFSRPLQKVGAWDVTVYCFVIPPGHERVNHVGFSPSSVLFCEAWRPWTESSGPKLKIFSGRLLCPPAAMPGLAYFKWSVPTVSTRPLRLQANILVEGRCLAS